MTLYRLLDRMARDLDVPTPSVAEMVAAVLVASLGIVALGGIYVIGWAVWS